MDRETDNDLLVATKDAPLHFDAWLAPHRSLSPRAFFYVMAAIAAVSFIAGLAFLRMGAWPVFGFFGLDVALIYYAFRRNFADARAHQTIQLSDALLKVRKVDAKGKIAAWTLKPYWTRVEIEADGDAARGAEEVHVRLCSHGRGLPVAECLSSPERLEFGAALSEALLAHRKGDRQVS